MKRRQVIRALHGGILLACLAAGAAKADDDYHNCLHVAQAIAGNYQESVTSRCGVLVRITLCQQSSPAACTSFLMDHGETHLIAKATGRNTPYIWAACPPDTTPTEPGGAAWTGLSGPTYQCR